MIGWGMGFVPPLPPGRLLVGMVVKPSPPHFVVTFPAVFCICRTVDTHYALSAPYKCFESCLLFIVENISSGTHHDDHIIVGQAFLGEYRSIFGCINLKTMFGSKLF